MNEKSKDIVNRLRSEGERMTVSRRAVIDVLTGAPSPMSAVQIHERLKKGKQQADKTTVYREIDFLLKKSVIKAMQFNERAKRYEVASQDHKHHLICTKCDKIDDVVLHNDLDHLEKIIGKTGFVVKSHALEFYGICKSCTPKSKKSAARSRGFLGLFRRG